MAAKASGSPVKAEERLVNISDIKKLLAPVVIMLSETNSRLEQIDSKIMYIENRMSTLDQKVNTIGTVLTKWYKKTTIRSDDEQEVLDTLNDLHRFDATVPVAFAEPVESHQNNLVSGVSSSR